MIPSSAIFHPNFSNIVHDIALLHSLGVRLVLVFGAREQIAVELAQHNLPNIYQDDLRITCEKTLACVLQAVGKLQAKLLAQFSIDMSSSPLAGAAISVVSGNFVVAKPCGVIGGVDLQHTGCVRKIAGKNIKKLLDNHMITLLSPLGYAPTGEVFNLSAYEIAAQTAIKLAADKLIIFDENLGITAKNGDLVREIAFDQIGDYAPHHLLTIAACACKNGVLRTHIISFSQDGAMLDELFTRKGSGTLIAAQSLEVIRKANHHDIGGILELIAPLEAQGILVKRSRQVLEQEISQFYVVAIDGLIIGCAALYPQQKAPSAELACLAISSEYAGQGFAAKLLQYLEIEAKKLRLQQIFVLTTHTEHWFLQHGFSKAQISDLPLERANCYNFQRNSKILLKNLA